MIPAQPGWKHRALHLGALWAFAIGKPLLDGINESGFFLLPRSPAPIDIVLIGLIALFAAPALLLGIEQLAGLASDRLRDGLHLAIVFVLLAVLAIQIVGNFGIREPKWAVLVSLLAAAAGAYAYARTTFVPLTLDVLSPAPVLFLILFLFFSPSGGLWLPGSEPENAEANVAKDPPIVFLILDEFPTGSMLDASGRIDESLYPNFAELGRRATWYENATTVADQTERAIPAILTGQRQDSEKDGEGMPVARAHPESVFTLLGDSYEIDAIETVTQLCPRGTCERKVRDGFAERFGRIVGDLTLYSPAAVLPTKVHERIFGIGSDVSPLPPDSPTELFELLVDGIATQPGQLDFLHAANLPHKPWTVVPSLQSYIDPADVHDTLEHEDEAEAPQAEIDDRKRHLLEVGAADTLVGEVVEKIESEGTWEDTLFVVVADHGISFRPNTGRRRASEENLDQLAFVPMFVKLPGQRRGGADPAAVQTIDVVPIIADALGVEIPWEVDGVLPGERTDDAISVVNYKGRMIESTLPELVRQRDRFDSVQSRVFVTGRGWNALIESGPGSELIGRPVPDSLPDAPGDAQVILSADPDDPDTVNAVIAGAVHGVGLGKPLAVAVNGRVAAATRTVGAVEGVRYEAVLPPEVYEGEVGEVQVLLVRKDGGFALLGSA
ncbi:MAG: sulfatase-like hydrolase/transferase [Solirubrobacterales bacterium]